MTDSSELPAGVTRLPDGRFRCRTARQSGATGSATATAHGLQQAEAWMAWARAVRDAGGEVPSGIEHLPPELDVEDEANVRLFRELVVELKADRATQHKVYMEQVHALGRRPTGKDVDPLGVGYAERDEATLAHIATLMDLPINRITPGHVKAIFKRMAEEGYGPMQERVLWLLKELMSYALDHERPKNWLHKVKLYKTAGGKRKHPHNSDARAGTIQEARQLVDYLPAVGRIVVWLALIMGLRLGEIFGLHLGDIVRLNDGRLALSVARQRFRIRSLVEGVARWLHVDVCWLKTSASYRTLPLPEQLESYLLAYLDTFHGDVDASELGNLPEAVANRSLVVHRVPAADGTFRSACHRAWYERYHIGLEMARLDFAHIGLVLTPHHWRRSCGGYLAVAHHLADATLDGRRIALTGRAISLWLGHATPVEIGLPHEWAAPVTTAVYMPEVGSDRLRLACAVMWEALIAEAGVDLGDFEESSDSVGDADATADSPLFDPGDWMDCSEAARALGVSDQRLLGLVREGRVLGDRGVLWGSQNAHRRVVVNRAALADLLELERRSAPIWQVYAEYGLSREQIMNWVKKELVSGEFRTPIRGGQRQWHVDVDSLVAFVEAETEAVVDALVEGPKRVSDLPCEPLRRRYLLRRMVREGSIVFDGETCRLAPCDGHRAARRGGAASTDRGGNSPPAPVDAGCDRHASNTHPAADGPDRPLTRRPT